MSIPDFIDRCAAFEARTGRSRTWLSKVLFEDTYRIRNLANGSSDVGVRRLERALAALADLEASTPTAPEMAG